MIAQRVPPLTVKQYMNERGSYAADRQPLLTVSPSIDGSHSRKLAKRSIEVLLPLDKL